MKKIIKNVFCFVLTVVLLLSSVLYVFANSKIFCVEVATGLFAYYDFDIKGNIISIVVNDNGTYSSFSLAEKHSTVKMNFTYENDQLTETILYQREPTHWSILNKTMNVYTEQKELIGQKRFIYEGEEGYLFDERILLYDEHGKLSSFVKSSYSKSLSVNTQTVNYIYDEKGYLIFENVLKNGEPEETISYKYDSFGRITEIKNKKGVTVFSYDSKGLLKNTFRYSLGQDILKPIDDTIVVKEKGNDTRTVNPGADLGAYNHYIVVYLYDKSLDLIAGHLDFSLYNETTISYGTNGSGLFDKVTGKAQGYIFESDTSYWTTIEPYDQYVTTIVGLSEEEMQAITLSFLALIIAVAEYDEANSSEHTSKHRVTQGKYAIYKMLSANCVTFVFDLLYPILTSRIDNAGAQIYGDDFELSDINMPDEGYELMCAVT